MNTLPSLAIVILAVVLVARRADVRLVLGLSALALFALGGRFPDAFRALAAEMANHKTVVPICSALGFAYVLKLTECDKHLVQFLVGPLRRVRILLIPGGVAAGYLVNTAVVSQTGTAAVLGPILVPLLRAGGMEPKTVGALLLLGSSMGGELFNPGAVEVVTLSEITGLAPPAIVARSARLNLLACGAALLVFWRLAVVGERQPDESAPEPPHFRVHPLKAIVPMVPVAILFAWPGFLPMPGGVVSKEVRELTSSATILTAMLIGSALAGATSPRKVGALMPAFFEGAGYAYTHVISLIVTATAFAKGMEACGLIAALTSGLEKLPSWAALVVGGLMAWALATLSGSGIAPAVAVMRLLVPSAEALGLDPVRLGTTIALAAHFGRTMSPVAAVALFSASITGTSAVDLVKRVALPLLAGGVVLFTVAALGLI